MAHRITRKWWRGYEGLYGTPGDALKAQQKPVTARSQAQSTLGIPEDKNLSTAKFKPFTEVKEQIIAATWLDRQGIIWYHIPNGGYRNPIEAAKFKRMGVKSGVPDICIPMARKGYHGLYIELKRVSGGKLSTTQTEWRDKLLREGYIWHEVKGD